MEGFIEVTKAAMVICSMQAMSAAKRTGILSNDAVPDVVTACVGIAVIQLPCHLQHTGNVGNECTGIDSNDCTGVPSNDALQDVVKTCAFGHSNAYCVAFISKQLYSDAVKMGDGNAQQSWPNMLGACMAMLCAMT